MFRIDETAFPLPAIALAKAGGEKGTSMSSEGSAPVTVDRLRAMKERGERITMLTAYDYPTAVLVDEAGVDVILVGDSLSMVVLGHKTTLPVTLDEMLHHTRAVSRGVGRALVVGDMPYGSYHLSREDSVRSAVRFLKEGGATAVKLEGGRKRLDTVGALLDAEVPVMGHVGLTPQSVNKLGGYKVQGKAVEEGVAILEDALALEAAGCFAVVLESVPTELARIITERLRVPTIGIGAGSGCDGQVLVFHDLLGMSGMRPKFLRVYAELGEEIRKAVRAYCEDVRTGAFPDDETEAYHMGTEAAGAVRNAVRPARPRPGWAANS